MSIKSFVLWACIATVVSFMALFLTTEADSPAEEIGKTYLFLAGILSLVAVVLGYKSAGATVLGIAAAAIWYFVSSMTGETVEYSLHFGIVVVYVITGGAIAHNASKYKTLPHKAWLQKRLLIKVMISFLQFIWCTGVFYVYHAPA